MPEKSISDRILEQFSPDILQTKFGEGTIESALRARLKLADEAAGLSSALKTISDGKSGRNAGGLWKHPLKARNTRKRGATIRR